MGITAKDLAQKLNISAAAVSMALNNKPGVSEKTRKYVFEEAEKYGYDFSRHVKVQAKVGCIYFILYKKHGAIVDDTPFFDQLLKGVSDTCRKAGYKMKLSYIYEEDEMVEKQIEDIQFSDCIGIILLGTEMLPSDIKKFNSLRIPIVLLDTYFETVDFDTVVIDNVQGAYTATRHLIKTLHEKPGYLHSSYHISNFEERESGYHKALNIHGMSSSTYIVHKLTPSIEGSYEDMKKLIESGDQLARCYFADNDLIAIGAIKALLKAGYRIPEDISIVGFDNLPMSGMLNPTLSTVDVPKHYMGELAVKRLIELITEGYKPPIKIAVRTKLIERRSSEC